MIVSELTKIIPDEITNSLVVLATPEDYAIIKDTITRIDIEPRQVLIEGLIAQVELKDNLSLGIAALFKANIFNLDANIALNAPNLILSPGSGFSFVGTDSNGNVRAFINALATDSKAKLLATPHILVSDNREARIQIGQQVPIVTSETYGSTTVAPQRTIQ
jgi:general secretion pathway protein D